ncbi:hypothetical protein MPH_03489 [Macrophomina phaseolina MS6]|uniref:Uncharacterized protein n=1 Tax=Macrophomina phaseolina (strain MS6) TaxID=1126212 RepID=K2S9W8_MACPH|nr:hypothetical protein MPH_03489 [Macrophomina phaseolina MS6]
MYNSVTQSIVLLTAKWGSVMLAPRGLLCGLWRLNPSAPAFYFKYPAAWQPWGRLNCASCKHGMTVRTNLQDGSHSVKPSPSPASASPASSPSISGAPASTSVSKKQQQQISRRVCPPRTTTTNHTRPATLAVRGTARVRRTLASPQQRCRADRAASAVGMVGRMAVAAARPWWMRGPGGQPEITEVEERLRQQRISQFCFIF